MRIGNIEKKIHSSIIFILISVSAFTQVVAQEISVQEKNFIYLWNTFDKKYSLFVPKRIDWDALYRIYRPRVSSQTSDSELFGIMSNLLGHLNDNHVRLNSPNGSFRSGLLGEIPPMDNFFPLIKNKYLHGYKERAAGISSGWLTDSIGYFHIQYFEDIEQSSKVIDQIINEFMNTKGIVIDVRENYGGEDEVGKMIADRFADKKRLYMLKHSKNGNSHDDFAPPQNWYVEPDGPVQYTKPVILLINRFSISEAEVFTLAMRVLPHVTIIGDATSGVCADVYQDTLPNGWTFRCPYDLIEDATGFCWEGIGIPADIHQTITKEDIDSGHERLLDLAIALLNTSKQTKTQR
jgi:carboxyl-terminal processing protease